MEPDPMEDLSSLPTEPSANNPIIQTPPLTAKEKRAIAYKRYYEQRREEILSNKKETYNQKQKREYYEKNKEHIISQMKGRYHTAKEEAVRDKLLQMKARFPCDEMKEYIDRLITNEVYKRMTAKQLTFWAS